MATVTAYELSPAQGSCSFQFGAFFRKEQPLRAASYLTIWLGAREAGTASASGWAPATSTYDILTRPAATAHVLRTPQARILSRTATPSTRSGTAACSSACGRRMGPLCTTRT